MRISLIVVLVVGILAGALSLVMIISDHSGLLRYVNLASLLEQTNVSQPVQFQIPKINVNATIEEVSLTSAGAVGVPKGIANVAWFALGPRPGERGNSIIVGHYGWYKNGTPAVFNNLNKLKPGDKLYVKDSKGVTVTFVVRELKIFSAGEDSSGVFSLDDGKAHLNLITCEGIWDKTQKTYSSRLVVFTDKE